MVNHKPTIPNSFSSSKESTRWPSDHCKWPPPRDNYNSTEAREGFKGTERGSNNSSETIWYWDQFRSKGDERRTWVRQPVLPNRVKLKDQWLKSTGKFRGPSVWKGSGYLEYVKTYWESTEEKRVVQRLRKKVRSKCRPLERRMK